MGRCPNNKKKGTRSQKCDHKAMKRSKFLHKHIDVVFDEYHAEKQRELRGEDPPPRQLDEDLPGLGQFYCSVTARYFETADALEKHKRTKHYKRTLKKLRDGPRPHNQLDADMAAGMGAPDNGPKLRSTAQVAVMMDV
mmetsp:Transcript_11588/g.42373  ORF Transcript_11588/g.42373 Transcript_11588/m.42373 type:complete len:138 (+) Transcript_11588:189-602(+)